MYVCPACDSDDRKGKGREGRTDKEKEEDINGRAFGLGGWKGVFMSICLVDVVLAWCVFYPGGGGYNNIELRGCRCRHLTSLNLGLDPSPL